MPSDTIPVWESLMKDTSSERGRRAGFDSRTGAVHGSGSGAGGKGSPDEDYDGDPQAGGGVEPAAAGAPPERSGA